MEIDFYSVIKVDGWPDSFVQKLKDDEGKDTGIRITLGKTSKIVSGTFGVNQEPTIEGNFVDIYFKE